MRFSVALCAALTALASSVAAVPVTETAVALMAEIPESESPLAKRQNIPAGTAIFKCKKANQVAITFDDGVFKYTVEALDMLKKANMKATFFVNGQNWDTLSNHRATLQRMIREKHQVGSHTWSHPHLTQLSTARVKTEMTRLDTELLRLIGRRPTYMRPPYFDYNANTLRAMRDLGYKVIIADIDTKDLRNRPSLSFKDFVNGIKKKGSIVLLHDVNRSSVRKVLPMIIEEIKKRKLKAVTVGECLGDKSANWYKTTPR